MSSIPLPSIRRLPVYLDQLRCYRDEGRATVSCTDLARDLDQDPTQVRKDLAITGVAGRPKVGYVLDELVTGIESFLGWNDCSQAFLAGAGNLGRALVGYSELRDTGLDIVCAFDRDARKQKRPIGRCQVLPPERLKPLARRMHIHIGIIAVPGDVAQAVAEDMIAGGITAIWNFAPVRLEVGEDIAVENADMLSGFAVLSHALQQGLTTKPHSHHHAKARR